MSGMVKQSTDFSLWWEFWILGDEQERGQILSYKLFGPQLGLLQALVCDVTLKQGVDWLLRTDKKL